MCHNYYFFLKRLASNRTRIWNLSSFETCAVKILNTNKCWWGCGRTGIPIHCCWACKIIQSSWKTFWKFLLSLKCTLTIWPSNIFLCLPQRKEIYIYIKSWTKMLIAVLLIKVQYWKLKLMTGKWNKQIGIPIQLNTTQQWKLPSLTTWMDLKKQPNM